MLKNYVTTALRQLRKHRSYTVINVIGLSLGITGSLLLFLLIRFWLSFDTYHEKADRIYRVVSTETYQGVPDRSGGVPQPFPEAFQLEFPEAEASTPIFYYPNYQFDGLVTVRPDGPSERKFQEQEGIAFATASFFTLFDRPLLLGNAQSGLEAPAQVVISERWADTFFGPSWRQGQPNLLDQTLSLDTLKDLQITGVMADFPANTDLPLDMLVSYATVEGKNTEWGSISSYSQFYVLLPKAADPVTINTRFPALVDKYHAVEADEGMDYVLQPLTEMHFDMEAGTFGDQEISKETVWTLIVVAIFLVLIACINFINLTTAVATKRAKEVGVRKVLGGTQRQLVRQFLGETTFITLLSVLIALGLTEAALLPVNNFLELSLEFSLLNDPALLLFLIGLVATVSLLSGLYPAWVLARFRPAEALKTSRVRGSGSFSLRQGLIVLQFVIAQVLVIGTIVLVRQMNYVRQADLGYDRATVVTIPMPGDEPDRKKTLRDQLRQLAGVENATLSFSDPTSGLINVTDFRLAGQPDDYNAEMKYGDQHYLDTYGLRLLAGEGLSVADTFTSAVVNEALLRQVGIAPPEAALGQMIKVHAREVPICGVVQDFNTQSLRDKISPTIIVDHSKIANTAALRLQTADLSGTLATIEKQWKQVYEGYNYEYEFLDDKLAELYERDQRLSVVLAVAAGVIIFIGCLGLYGLVTFMAEQKTKEIGVRKVLGASVGQIIGLFSAEFIKLVVVAFVLAAPVAYYLLRQWLQGFEYKITLGVSSFAWSILATLAIALLTVTHRSVQAARANPVDSLRNE